jgi:peptidoglycan/LPS O-acetylase OafA/YrhL
LLFPFMLPAIWALSDRAKLAVALFLFALLMFFAFLTKGNFDQWDGPITLLRCLPEFILGTLLYCAFRRAPNNSLLGQSFVAYGITAVIVISLHVDAPDLLITFLFATLVLTAVLNTGSFSEIANVRPLIWLGDISYSLYLIHGFIQFLATKSLAHAGIQNHADLSIQQSLGLMLMMVAACLISAHFTYFGVEIGCRKYLRGIFGIRRKMQTVPVTVPSSRTISARQRVS